MNIDFSKFLPDKAAIVLGVISAIIGWGVHAFSIFNSDQSKLDQHTVQIQHLQAGEEKLWKGQQETHDALNTVAVTMARVDGKIDVLTQKVDDDRAANAANARRK